MARAMLSCAAMARAIAAIVACVEVGQHKQREALGLAAPCPRVREP